MDTGERLLRQDGKEKGGKIYLSVLIQRRWWVWGTLGTLPHLTAGAEK